MKNRASGLFVLTLSVFLLSLFFDYQHILFYRPESIHFWRQCDGASIALNYYQFDMNFFHPELHCLLDGTHGYAVEECPIVYYLVALAYKTFGFHEFLFRLIVLLFFYTGVLFAYRLALLLLRNIWWSVLCALTLFTFPVLVNYSPNFLPNVPAFAMDLTALYLFFLAIETQRYRWFVAAVIVATLCGLLKISSLLSFTVLLILFIAGLFQKKRYWQLAFLYKKRWLSLLLLLLVPFLNLSWILWAKRYNQLHHNALFLMDIVPVWKMPASEIKMVAYKILKDWIPFYASFPAVIVWAAMTGYILYFRRRCERFLFHFYGLLLLGSGSYCLLFFGQLYVHDYYIICLYTFFLITAILFLHILQKQHPTGFLHPLAKGTTAIFLVLGIIHSKQILSDKYYGIYKQAADQAFYDPGLSSYLNTLGINKNSVAIVLPDASPNGALYLLNVKGQTNFPHPVQCDLWFNDPVNKNAAYLIVADSNYLHSGIRIPRRYTKMGQYKKTGVYRLLPGA